MNKNKLKAYAPAARREFIQAVTDRANLMGLSEDAVERAELRGDVLLIAGRAYPKDVYPQRQALEARVRREGFRQVVEEAAYSWFNRLTALRYMELHNYLDHGLRILSNPSGSHTPEILEKATRVELRGIQRERVIELKLAGDKDAELYRMLLVAQCNQLHASMPFLFERINDETELLLPDNLLHSDSLIRRLVTGIDEADWSQVEIIGWLYQFYISERKDEVIGRVVKSEDIPAATQLFTPNWIVKYMVQNSVGRMWLQTYPSSALKGKMDYYIEPAEQTEEVEAQLERITPEAMDPERVTILDPACGSGHILVEAYDLMKELYQERGYRQRDIARLILEKNLYGLDIDERAAQLAGFALLMKARGDDRRILEDAPRLNVLAIGESAGLKADELAGALLQVGSQPRAGVSREEIVDVLELFREGKTLGSLISVPDELAQRLPAIRGIVEENLNSGELYAREAASALLPFVRQAEVLAAKYDCVIANPPYMGSKYFNANLKSFVNARFPNSKSDLFAAFIERGFDLTKTSKFHAMITMESWMFQSSYESFRNKLLTDKTFITMTHMPYEGKGRTSLGINFGTVAVASINKHIKDYKVRFSYIRHTDIDADGIPFSFPVGNNRLGYSNVDGFKKIPGSPIAYWATEKVRNIFEASPNLQQTGHPCSGIQTGDNERFLKQWYEPNIQKIGFNLTARDEASNSDFKWFPHKKGGDFRRWYGNCDYVIDWENDGEEIIKHPSARPQNLSYMFKEGVTWSHTSSATFSARYSESGFSFNVEGPTYFSDNPKLSLGYLCSNTALHFMEKLSGTLHFLVGNIALLPFNQKVLGSVSSGVEDVVSELINIARGDWNSFETSWDFQVSPLLRSGLKAATVEESFDNWQAHCDANIRRMRELETENNRLFIEAYGLQDELTPEVPEEQITLARANAETDTRRLVSYAVGCMMGRYSLDKPGLIYANSAGTGFEPSQYTTFHADDDGIIPVTDLEWFTDDACKRFVEFLHLAWSPETLDANLRFVAAGLSPKQNELPRDTLRRYLSNGFFKDHLQTYKKRPIYWLFSSGKQKAFECLVYLHRYTPSTLSRMRNEYVTPLFGKLSAQIEYLTGEVAAAASTAARNKLQKTLDALRKKQTELQAFDDELRHYADRRIALDLDEGVRVNYGKFGNLLAETRTIAAESE